MEDNKLNKESFKLFFIKERKVIRGKNRMNWWILFAMFLVTILSISFSKSSLTYLEEKMNDPFINWVNVQNRSDASLSKMIKSFDNTIQYSNLSKSYGIQNVEQNIYCNFYFITPKNKPIPFEGRTIKLSSPILNRILGTDNLIEGRSLLTSDKSIGLIVTKDMLTRMGYNETPLFIDLAFPFNKENQSTVNELYLNTSYDYFGAPIPIVAVVKQLPGMMSFLCMEYFVQQKVNQENTFDLLKPEYTNSIEFAVRNANIKNKVDSSLRILTKKIFSIDEHLETNSYIDYTLLSISFDKNDSISTKEIGLLAKAIGLAFDNSKLLRVFSYNTSSQVITIPTDYLSIDFNRLDSIQSFAKWANEECGVKIDMTQIDAKNNFGLINRLGNSLSLIIVIISIAFIVIFLINLFRNHFEKVKKNIGTFKAFGLGNGSLIRIYMAVLSYMILSALFFALIVSFIIQLITIFFGKLNEGESILNVLSNITLYSMLVTILISLFAIYFTVSKLLKSTPGDLIYERD